MGFGGLRIGLASNRETRSGGAEAIWQQKTCSLPDSKSFTIGKPARQPTGWMLDWGALVDVSLGNGAAHDLGRSWRRRMVLVQLTPGVV
jgi:hypothetical protein